jgi:hypothetical protein
MMRRRRFDLPIATAIVVLCSLSCTRDTTLAPPERDRVSLGTWGGDNAGLIVTDSVAHLHVGCTFGDIAGRIQLDASGAFDVGGIYQPRAYPIAVGPAVPARFTGVVQGRRLTISVVVNDTVDKTVRQYGPVTVVFAEDPRLGPCPICLVPGLRRQRPTGR